MQKAVLRFEDQRAFHSDKRSTSTVMSPSKLRFSAASKSSYTCLSHLCHGTLSIDFFFLFYLLLLPLKKKRKEKKSEREREREKNDLYSHL